MIDGSFGREEREFADDLSSAGYLMGLMSFEGLGEHEVTEEVTGVEVSAEDILGGNISMDEFVRVGGIESATDLDSDAKGFAPGEEITDSDEFNDFGQ